MFRSVQSHSEQTSSNQASGPKSRGHFKDHMTRVSFIRLTGVATIMLASASASTADAESIMKQCGAEWQTAKVAGTGKTWSSCNS